MASYTPTSIDSLLVKREGVQGGRLCLRGTRITVQNVAIHHMMGATIDEMCADNPDLDPSLFYAAPAHYYANRAQLDADIELDEKESAELRAQYPHGVGPDTSRT